VNSFANAVDKSGVVNKAVLSGNLPWLGNVVPRGGFPISDLSILGSNLMKIGASMYAVGIVGGILSSMISLVSFTFGTLLFAPGIALAYILPLLPFIHFVFAVFGWILALVEAVIEIPIFALAHLDPEGEGVFPQATRAGYHLLLKLILRPLLICIGFIVSILLMNGMIDFVNLVFNATVFAVQTNSSVSIFSQIIYTIIYARLVYSICNSCFKAIDYIPNHALRWIGASGDMHDSSQAQVMRRRPRWAPLPPLSRWAKSSSNSGECSRRHQGAGSRGCRRSHQNCRRQREFSRFCVRACCSGGQQRTIVWRYGGSWV
jgi:hypothetical protein